MYIYIYIHTYIYIYIYIYNKHIKLNNYQFTSVYSRNIQSLNSLYTLLSWLWPFRQIPSGSPSAPKPSEKVWAMASPRPKPLMLEAPAAGWRQQLSNSFHMFHHM